MLSRYWKTLLARVIALLLLGSTILLGRSSSSRSADATDVQTSNESQRQAMINILGSPHPNPAIGDEAQTFDRLVGTWDADFSFPHDDGTVSHKKGEIRFGWVMDGTAIQDLWISYPTGGKQQRSIGTTFRFFDTNLKQWRIVFINPRFNYLVTAQGGRQGDRIVLHGLDTDGLPLRWTFSDITPSSFHWQGEKSRDGGKTWKVEEDHHMKRRSS
jgi:hypothetical protein